MSRNTERFKDFDEFWSERNVEPLKVKVFGKVYTLPGAIPASVVLALLRAQAEGVQELQPSAVLTLAESLFGKSVLDEWLAQGMQLDQLVDVIRWVTDQYGQRIKQQSEVDSDPT